MIFDRRSGLPPISDRTTTENVISLAGREIIVIRGLRLLAMSILEPILVVYSEPPKAIDATDLRQARVDEFLASRSL